MTATGNTARRMVVAALAATIGLGWMTVARADGVRVVTIEIQKFKFVPERVQLRVGDVVQWRNLDIVPHTATAMDRGWSSDKMASKGEWKTTVTAEMSGDYYCKYHPNMVARLDVEE